MMRSVIGLGRTIVPRFSTIARPSPIPIGLAKLSSASTIVSPFEQRNVKLNRPVSPHMLIYKWPITALTSGSHRVTGTLMSLAVYGLSGAIYAATGHSQEVVDFIQNLNLHPTLLMSMKALFIWPLCFHLVYGLRFTVWDLGYGYEKSSFRAVGITLVFASIGLALLIANLKPKCDSKGNALPSAELAATA